VWLMKRFLYKPIIDAIDAREQRIAAEIADADSKREAAQKERNEFQHKNEEFERQRATLLNQAIDEVKAERERLLDKARVAANDLGAKRLEALRHEQLSLTGEITRRTQEGVFFIARKTLADLAGTSLEERISDVFTRRVRELSGAAKEEFTNALRSSSKPAVLRSTFALPKEQRTAIQVALNETFGAAIQISFETAPTVISGIELTASGQKIGWSIADYLMSLERSVDELLHRQSQARVNPANEPETKIE